MKQSHIPFLVNFWRMLLTLFFFIFFSFSIFFRILPHLIVIGNGIFRRTLILEDYPEQNRKFLEENNIQFFQFGVAGNKV